MRVATARAASRRGSSITILPARQRFSANSASGTPVDLPAPGGACSTTLRCADTARSQRRATRFRSADGNCERFTDLLSGKEAVSGWRLAVGEAKEGRLGLRHLTDRQPLPQPLRVYTSPTRAKLNDRGTPCSRCASSPCSSLFLLLVLLSGAAVAAELPQRAARERRHVVAAARPAEQRDEGAGRRQPARRRRDHGREGRQGRALRGRRQARAGKRRADDRRTRSSASTR